MSLGPDQLPPASASAGSDRQRAPARNASHPGSESLLDPQDLHIDLTGAAVARPDLDGFRPVAAFKAALSEMASKRCLTLSDIGFLAASRGSTLLVVDLRGSDVLLLDVPGHASSIADGRGGKGKGKPDSSPITALQWTICSLGEGECRERALAHHNDVDA